MNDEAKDDKAVTIIPYCEINKVFTSILIATENKMKTIIKWVFSFNSIAL